MTGPTRGQALEWAREARLMPVCEYIVAEADRIALERLAALAYAAGQAAEREACAALLEANAEACRPESTMRLILETNAAAIRARGQS